MRQKIWDDKRTKAAQKLGYEGLSIDRIAEACFLTVGQVNYRFRKIGLSVKKHRNGESERAKSLIAAVTAKLRP